MTKFMLFILFVIVSFIAACSNPKSESCPCNIKFLNMNADGSYGFQDSHIDTMTDINSVSSSIIRVTINPGDRASGTTPTAQYMMTSGHTLVPKTTTTSELFSLYKNMEDLYKLDVLVGTNKYLHYPREISLQLLGVHTNSINNNAFYSAQFDRITVLKYSGDLIPLSINQGLIAHEHFHAIFESIVKLYDQTTLRVSQSGVEAFQSGDQLVPENLDPIRGFNFLLLESLDEGMADFWGYLSTGLASPFLASFPASVMSQRAVQENVSTIPNQQNLSILFDYKRFIREQTQQKQKNDAPREQQSFVHGEIYVYATIYSNLLRKMSDQMFGIPKVISMQDKKIVGQWILSSLLKLKTKLSEKKINELFSPVDFVSSFMPDDPIQKESSGVCLTAKTFLMNYNAASLCN